MGAPRLQRESLSDDWFHVAEPEISLVDEVQEEEEDSCFLPSKPVVESQKKPSTFVPNTGTHSERVIHYAGSQLIRNFVTTLTSRRISSNPLLNHQSNDDKMDYVMIDNNEEAVYFKQLLPQADKADNVELTKKWYIIDDRLRGYGQYISRAWQTYPSTRSRLG